MIRPGKTKLKGVNRVHPCEVCGGNHKCSRGADGLLVCGRQSGDVPGFVCLGPAKGDSQFSLYRRQDDPLLEDSYPPHANGGAPSRNGKPHANGQPNDWQAHAEEYAKALTPKRRHELAEALGLPEWVLEEIPRIGYRARGPHKDPGGPCFTFPEENADGRIIGINCRYRDGTKKAMSGSSRGLTIPRRWQEREGPIFVAEGASCTLALTAIGMSAIGRPSNMGGVDLLVELLRDIPKERPLVVLGEWDANEQGAWPGRDGAVATAAALQSKLGRSVCWALPPDRCKDARAWVLAQEPPLEVADAWLELSEKWLNLLAGHYQEPRQGQPIKENIAASDNKINLTDRGNAMRLVRHFGTDLRHCHPWHKWLTWDGQRWRLDDTGMATRRAKDTIAELFAWSSRKLHELHEQWKNLGEDNHDDERSAESTNGADEEAASSLPQE